jgi:poly(3-hydroxybutyrate) depolymerase
MRSRVERLHLGFYAICCIGLLAGCGDDGSAAAETDAATDGSGGTEQSSDSDPSTSTGTTTGDASDSSASDSQGSSGGETGDTGEPVIPDMSPGCDMPFSEDWLQPYTVYWGEETIRATVMASGVEREFLLELPETIDPNTPLPILFTFHGYGAQMDNAFGQNVIDHWPGVVAIYPQALENGSGVTSWDFNPSGQDAAFFVAMINEIGNRMCLDMNRVYVQGTSNGGMMSNFLACIRSDIIDGVAVAASSFPISSDQCLGPVPAFVMHGRNDTTVSFSSGEQVRDIWLSLNGCSGPGEAIAKECTQWLDCSSGAPVVWCPHDGGHDQPAAAGLVDEVYAFLMAL